MTLFQLTVHSIWSYRAVNWTLAGLFILAGSLKVQDLEGFARVIHAYNVLPRPLIEPAALFLAPLELLAGIGLLFHIRGSLSVITALLGMFLLVLAYAIAMGLDVDCGCFGPGDPEGDAVGNLRSAVLRDFGMVGSALFLYWWRAAHKFEPVRPWDRIRKKSNRKGSTNDAKYEAVLFHLGPGVHRGSCRFFLRFLREQV